MGTSPPIPAHWAPVQEAHCNRGVPGRKTGLWTASYRVPGAGSLRPLLVLLTRTGRWRGRHMDQGAGIGVFDHPQRAIGAFFHIADAVPDIPALGGFGAAMAVKDDAVERPRPQPADEPIAIPLREGLSAVVEHQIAR